MNNSLFSVSSFKNMACISKKIEIHAKSNMNDLDQQNIVCIKA